MKDEYSNDERWESYGKRSSGMMAKAWDICWLWCPSLVGQSTDNTVVFFHAANWCPSCRAADSSLSAEHEIPAGSDDSESRFWCSETDLKKKVWSSNLNIPLYSSWCFRGNQIKKWLGGT